jgi:hypothetical protein
VLKLFSHTSPGVVPCLSRRPFFWTRLSDTHAHLSDSLLTLTQHLPLISHPCFQHPRGLPGKHHPCPIPTPVCRTAFCLFLPSPCMGRGSWKFPSSTTTTLRFSACCGKQPKHPRKMPIFRCFFADHFGSEANAISSVICSGTPQRGQKVHETARVIAEKQRNQCRMKSDIDYCEDDFE